MRNSWVWRRKLHIMLYICVPVMGKKNGSGKQQTNKGGQQERIPDGTILLVVHGEIPEIRPSGEYWAIGISTPCNIFFGEIVKGGCTPGGNRWYRKNTPAKRARAWPKHIHNQFLTRWKDARGPCRARNVLLFSRAVWGLVFLGA